MCRLAAARLGRDTLEESGHCALRAPEEKRWVAKVNPLLRAPPGQVLISGDWNGMIKMWNVQGNCVHEVQGHSFCVRALCEHGSLICSGSADRAIKI